MTPSGVWPRPTRPSTRRVIEHLFAHRVLDNLSAAQGILRLGKRSGAHHLEAACRRALRFGDPRYRAVKTLLHKGLAQEPEGPPPPGPSQCPAGPPCKTRPPGPPPTPASAASQP
ncbi:hypothetical protein JCM30394_32160 [Deferrisoma palaeochoriense]